ncbi:hypothetical protein KC330_g8586 [Hortaea werneckii]|nr:hypothetical protein KC330_g8586 [Hortaea werneckii]
MEVYLELLVWPSDRLERCWPQILATCRQVNDEAKDIIYTENAAKVQAVITARNRTSPPPYDSISWSLEYKGGREFNALNDPIDWGTSATFRDFNFRCSPFLLKQTSVQLDIKLQTSKGNVQPQDVAPILSRVIYTLSSALLHCKVLKSLRVCFDRVDPEVFGRFGNEVLWSLSKLGLPATALSIEGLSTNKPKDWAAAMINSNPGSPVDLLPRVIRAHMVSHRLVVALILNEPDIKSVSQAAYDEGYIRAGDCQEIDANSFQMYTERILDREGEESMIDVTKRLEVWMKTAVKALEPEFEAAKARIDAVMSDLRKVTEPEIPEM